MADPTDRYLYQEPDDLEVSDGDGWDVSLEDAEGNVVLVDTVPELVLWLQANNMVLSEFLQTPMAEAMPDALKEALNEELGPDPGSVQQRSIEFGPVERAWYAALTLEQQQEWLAQRELMVGVLQERFNPNHDPRNGQFTSGHGWAVGAGGAKAGQAVAAPSGEAVDLAAIYTPKTSGSPKIDPTDIKSVTYSKASKAEAFYKVDWPVSSDYKSKEEYQHALLVADRAGLATVIWGGALHQKKAHSSSTDLLTAGNNAAIMAVDKNPVHGHIEVHYLAKNPALILKESKDGSSLSLLREAISRGQAHKAPVILTPAPDAVPYYERFGFTSDRGRMIVSDHAGALAKIDAYFAQHRTDALFDDDEAEALGYFMIRRGRGATTK